MKKITFAKCIYLTVLMVVSAVFIGLNFGHEDMWYGLLLYSIFTITSLKVKPAKIELPVDVNNLSSTLLLNSVKQE